MRHPCPVGTRRAHIQPPRSLRDQCASNTNTQFKSEQQITATSLVGADCTYSNTICVSHFILDMPRFKDDVKFMKPAPPFTECECFDEHGMQAVARMLQMIHFSEYVSKFGDAGARPSFAPCARIAWVGRCVTARRVSG